MPARLVLPVDERKIALRFFASERAQERALLLDFDAFRITITPSDRLRHGRVIQCIDGKLFVHAHAEARKTAASLRRGIGTRSRSTTRPFSTGLHGATPATSRAVRQSVASGTIGRPKDQESAGSTAGSSRPLGLPDLICSRARSGNRSRARSI
jgi:hypothetical protein